MSKDYGDSYDWEWMASLQTWIEVKVIEDRIRERGRLALAQQGKGPIITPMISDELPVSSSPANCDAYPDSFFLCEENWQHREMGDGQLRMLKTLLPDFFLLPKVD
ncbi:uncharacterized protein LOC131019703 [Salvia miltiorrhiza]|uniref:uncharacterized protein LOC131019703 n=1 Tax=Salvia miltiorrhiza TaxID=226208 RepID=UPI0025AC7002|nr:uncharacterized protein LOC131019703 [Salvia miltiorrhiza]